MNANQFIYNDFERIGEQMERGTDIIELLSELEDIIDSGYTMREVMKLLKARDPKSLKLCACLSKPSRREYDVNIDYLGFEIPDQFVIGYGLDYAEKYRNLPYIGYIE